MEVKEVRVSKQSKGSIKRKLRKYQKEHQQ